MVILACIQGVDDACLHRKGQNPHIACSRETGAGTGVLGRGLRGLVGGVTAGVTGVVRTPLQSYNDGTGVMTGMTFPAVVQPCDQLVDTVSMLYVCSKAMLMCMPSSADFALHAS